MYEQYVKYLNLNTDEKNMLICDILLYNLSVKFIDYKAEDIIIYNAIFDEANLH
jgi:hypothetical protein